MVLNADSDQHSVETTHPTEGGNRFKPHVHEETEHHGDEKCHNLIGSKARCEYPNAHIGAGQEQQADVAAPCAAAVDVAYGFAQKDHGNEINEGWDEADGHQNQSAQVFCNHQTQIVDGSREQELNGSCAFFFREAAHGDGRDEEHEHPRRHHEEGI